MWTDNGPEILDAPDSAKPENSGTSIAARPEDVKFANHTAAKKDEAKILDAPDGAKQAVRPLIPDVTAAYPTQAGNMLLEGQGLRGGHYRRRRKERGVAGSWPVYGRQQSQQESGAGLLGAKPENSVAAEPEDVGNSRSEFQNEIPQPDHTMFFLPSASFEFLLLFGIMWFFFHF